jgi:hypothetical protein
MDISPPWQQEDLREAIEEFSDLYGERPILDNRGGMGAPGAFALWFAVRWIKPKLVVESGVWKGQTTWLIEQAAPSARLLCIDPILSRLKYRSRTAEYATTDFSQLGLSTADTQEGLVLFDDHQNQLDRLLQAADMGFPHAVFDDNYPTYHRTLTLECCRLGIDRPKRLHFGRRPMRISRSNRLVPFPQALDRLPPSAGATLSDLCGVYYMFPPVVAPKSMPAYAGKAAVPPLLRDVPGPLSNERDMYRWTTYVGLAPGMGVPK